MSKSSSFQQDIHVYRAFAIMAVVGTHVASSMHWQAYPLLGKWIVQFCNEASVYFVFVAGYLFQFLSKKYIYSNYLKTKLKFVILPYIIVSIPALIIFSFYASREGMWSWFYELDAWQKMAIFIISGKHVAPYWFIPMITLFYLAAPLFLYIDRRAQLLYWAIIPLLALALYIGRDSPLGPLHKAVYMLPVYLLGMCVSRFKDYAQELILKFWPLLLAIFLISYVAAVFDLSTPPSYLLAMKVAGALLLLKIMSKTYHWFGDKLDYISDISFGIYFVHSYLITLSKIFMVWMMQGKVVIAQVDGILQGSVVVFFSYFVFIMLASVATVWIGQKVLGKKSKFVFGA